MERETNLLEAISMLAPGRGLRRAGREELGYRAPQVSSRKTGNFCRNSATTALFLSVQVSQNIQKKAGLSA